MEHLWMVMVDAAAILLLTFGLYFRRHHRRDLVTAFVVVNIGVFAVAAVLSSLEIGIGVGLGLFGVLSIIRLRSSEISQHEVAYYFASLAIGLIAGFDGIDPVLGVALIALILLAVALVDSRKVLVRSRQQTLRLDGADLDLDTVRARLEPLIGAPVRSVSITRVDLVDDTLTVNVRWADPRPRDLRTTQAGASQTVPAQTVPEQTVPERSVAAQMERRA